MTLGQSPLAYFVGWVWGLNEERRTTYSAQSFLEKGQNKHMCRSGCKEACGPLDKGSFWASSHDMKTSHMTCPTPWVLPYQSAQQNFDASAVTLPPWLLPWDEGSLGCWTVSGFAEQCDRVLAYSDLGLWNFMGQLHCWKHSNVCRCVEW